MKLLRKIFGSRNDRLVKQMYLVVDQINALEGEISQLSDADLTAKTEEFRKRHADGESLDDLLPEAFAVVREAGKRVLEMRHFDVQLIGGMVLHKGKIAEMRTGEGKTLVATLAVYLNAIPGNGVHIVTVNDYLAQRDSDWMGRIYKFLGLSVGVIINDLDNEKRLEAYSADITYGTNNEFGFDYLRDNMAFSNEERVQRELNFAVVDEVDSILIDEARTPLIISGPSDESSGLYNKINVIVPKLVKYEGEIDVTNPGQEINGDYTVDEKGKQIQITELGFLKVEKLMLEEGLLEENDSLYDSNNITLMHHLDAAVRAHALFQKDVDYIVQNNEIVIVDEFTGRALPGRRWSDGLHQAVEAKEGLKIEAENQTLASITFQNLFRMYNKLSGMTGTADTEAFEFHSIYALEVVVIPTNKPMLRDDRNDLVFVDIEDKMQAIVEDVLECNKSGQPVLVGTTSIEMSEYLSNGLSNAKIKHEVLNAKHHEREAEIVANAGAPSSVTIATNMAGRGTDIVLGGNLEVELKKLKKPSESSIQKVKDDWAKRHQMVIDAGGLHIVGTERHESRRIDNQLRGRSGRQGDPGSSRFYLSLKDNLMRIFASERVATMMKRLGMKPGEPIEHGLVSRAIEGAQRKVEAHNFDIRKNLLDYDDVANDQRKFVYNQRNVLMAQEDVSGRIKEMRHEVVNSVISQSISPGSLDELWDIPELETSLEENFGTAMPVQKWLDKDDSLHEETLREKIIEELEAVYSAKTAEFDQKIEEGQSRYLEKAVFLDRLDHHWKEHLAAMDHLRQGIHLHGYAQKNPKQEYKRISFEMFEELLGRIQHDVVHLLSTIDLMSDEEAAEAQTRHRMSSDVNYLHAEADNILSSGEAEGEESHTPYRREDRKVGRNEPCPCNSGKKYKQCHGKLS